jgi:hypothetical protein
MEKNFSTPAKRTPLDFDLATEIGVIGDIERGQLDKFHAENAQEIALINKLLELQKAGKLREYKRSLQEKLYLK